MTPTEEAAQMARNCAQMVKELLAAKDEELKRLREAAEEAASFLSELTDEIEIYSDRYDAQARKVTAKLNAALYHKEPNNE